MPLTAATNGLVRGAFTKPANPHSVTAGAAPSDFAFRSLPAQKMRPPEEVRTAARTDSSASIRRTIACRAAAVWGAIEFPRCGRLMVTMATPSSTW
ncbi:MAG TPA: hypothetical protein VHZ03_06760 [Trebonia sp.]|jgi:hypothetical protein|nr:hypothetical protein [Trebonia sp.]